MCFQGMMSQWKNLEEMLETPAKRREILHSFMNLPFVWDDQK